MPRSPSQMPIAGESEAMAEMSAELFLRSLRGLGVELRARDGKLALSAPPGVVTTEMQAELRRRKAELMELLTAEVTYSAQGKDYSVQMSTLANSQTPAQPSGTGNTQSSLP